MSQVVLVAELLGHQDLAGLRIPVAGPLLVRPAQGEGEVGGARCEHLVEGALEEPATVEPVVVVDEPRNAVLGSQGGLCLAHFGNPQVVVAELGRDLGLAVAGVERPGLGDVAPLGEAVAPPSVVFGNGVELG